MSYWVGVNKSTRNVDEIANVIFSNASYDVYPLSEITGTIPADVSAMIDGSVSVGKAYTE